jgi:uncharacterized protein YjdB
MPMEDRVMKKNKLFFLLAFLVLLVSGIKAKAETLTGQAHMQNSGWQTSQTVNENQILNLGIVDTTLRVEAMKISVTGPVSGGINYQAQSQSLGWQPAVSDGQIAGTVGKSLRMETIKVSLTGDLATSYNIYYRTQVENYGWLGWTKDGNASGTVSKSLRLQALQLVLVKKGSTLPITVDTSKNPCISPDDPLQTYRTISSTNVYPQNTLFAIDQNGRNDGLYSAPYATDNTADNANQKAKIQHGTVVLADKSVLLSEGTTFIHINLNGTWCWIDSRGISSASPTFKNLYGIDGTITYYLDSSKTKLVPQIQAAIDWWNKKVPGVFVAATPSTPASRINIVFEDSDDLPSKWWAGTYTSGEIKFSNTLLIPNKDLQGTTQIIEHELAHALGVAHTGDNNWDFANHLLPGVAPWSWSTVNNDSDLMWVWSSGTKNSYSVLPTNEFNEVKLIRDLKVYNNPHPLASGSSTEPVTVIGCSQKGE